jgi:hypothetical protein
MNRMKRYAIRQILHSLNVRMMTDTHELWRLWNVEKSGLTEKERAFLKKTWEDQEAVNQRLSKFGQHLQKGL